MPHCLCHYFRHVAYYAIADAATPRDDTPLLIYAIICHCCCTHAARCCRLLFSLPDAIIDYAYFFFFALRYFRHY